MAWAAGSISIPWQNQFCDIEFLEEAFSDSKVFFKKYIFDIFSQLKKNVKSFQKEHRLEGKEKFEIVIPLVVYHQEINEKHTTIYLHTIESKTNSSFASL